MSANTNSLDLENGSTQYASIADGSQTGLDITGDLTLAGWFKIESKGSGPLIAKFDYGGATNQRSYELLFITGVNDNLRFIVSDDGTAGTSADSNNLTVSTGTWYYFAVTYDASAGTCAFYQGDQSTLPAAIGTGASLKTSIHNGTAPFALGAYFSDGTAQDTFDGMIDEAVIYNDIRTLSELQNNYKKDQTSEPNLQGYWQLNNDYVDSSGNGNTLTASGSPIFVTDVPFSTYEGVVEDIQGYFNV